MTPPSSSRPKKATIMQATVARENRGPGGGWWLMNKKETGWSSSVCGVPSGTPYRHDPFPSLMALLERWDVRLGTAGVDKHGVYVEILPGGEPPAK